MTHPKRRNQASIVDALGSKIVCGKYQPGEILPSIPELKEDFGVSQSVMREVLGVLSDKGLIESRQKRGTVVCHTDSWSLLDPDVLRWYTQSEHIPKEIIDDLFELRRVLEPDAAMLASQKATPPQILKIRQGYQGMCDAVQNNDLDTYFHSDLSFHVAILQATNNRFLDQLSGIVHLMLAIISLAQRSPLNTMEDSLPLHKKVLEAIVNGNEEQAHAAMMTLLNHSKRLFERIRGKI